MAIWCYNQQYPLKYNQIFAFEREDQPHVDDGSAAARLLRPRTGRSGVRSRSSIAVGEIQHVLPLAG